MKYAIQVEQAFAVDNDLTLTEAVTLAAIVNLPLFAQSYVIDNVVYYWFTYAKLCEDFPLLFKCEDRARKNVKVLEEKGYIKTTKIGAKKVLAFTEKCAGYGIAPKTAERAENGNDAPKTAELTPKTAEKAPKTADHLYNINNNNISNNMAPSKEFDDDTQGNKKTLFRNSATARLVEVSKGPADDFGVAPVTLNYSKFVELFPGDDFKKIDLVYYYNAVADWSDQKNTKRTNRGWIATIKNFIRGDMEKGKVHLLPEWQPKAAGDIDVNEALNFLNM